LILVILTLAVTISEETKVARRVINPTIVKSQGDAALDQILKLSSQIATENAKNRRQTELISFQKGQDTLKAIEKGKETVNKNEKRFTDDFYNPILEAIAKGDIRTAEALYGQKEDGEGSLYAMRFNSLVTEEGKGFFYSPEELKSQIDAKKNKPNTLGELDRLWFSNDPSIPVFSTDQNKASKDFAYDGYVDLLAKNEISVEDFNKRMTFAKDRFGTELGISPAVSKGDVGAGTIQSALNRQNMSMTGFASENFFTDEKAIEYFKTLSNDFKAQTATNLFGRQVSAEQVGLLNEQQLERLRRELWANESSRKAKVLMDDLASSTIYRESGGPTLFDVTEQKVKGKSLQSQAIVNNFTSLAIESIPDLRRENDTEKLKKMLQDPKYKNQVVQILSDVLQVSAEDLTPYLTSDRFRLKIIAD
jgi:hypothetical protein